MLLTVNLTDLRYKLVCQSKYRCQMHCMSPVTFYNPIALVNIQQYSHWALCRYELKSHVYQEYLQLFYPLFD